jgi:hypothetical protein
MWLRRCRCRGCSLEGQFSLRGGDSDLQLLKHCSRTTSITEKRALSQQHFLLFTNQGIRPTLMSTHRSIKARMSK